MDSLSWHIRKTTGLTMQEFCTNYLDVNFPAFRSRLKKNGIPYPDEALLICLVTGLSPVELFDRQAIEVFLLNGKESVRNRIKDIIKDNPSEKINMILNDPSGLKIDVGDINAIGKPRKLKEKKTRTKMISFTNGEFKTDDQKLIKDLHKSPHNASNKKDDFDFIEENIFKR